jgi:hypothetical protein
VRPSGTVSADAVGEEPPFASAPVEDLLRLLGKAVRAHQLYLPNNPVYKSSIEQARSAFAPLWDLTDELPLRFTEADIKWFGKSVLAESAKSADSLPWTFFKDGIREIVLTPGFEHSELEKFLAILKRVRIASPDDDDLLTLLWEGDFANLRYRYVDLGGEGGPALADGSPAVAAVGADSVRAAAHEDSSDTKSAVVNMQDFDATLYFLDEKELEYLRGEVDREYNSDLRRSVLASLLDIYESQPTEPVREEVSALIEQLLLFLLAAGQLRSVAYLLKEIQSLTTKLATLSDEQRRRLAQIPNGLSSPEPLGQLLQSLDESADLPPQGELTDLFEQLRPEALGTIFAWTPRLQNAGVKALVEQSAGRLANSNLSVLASLIGSRDRIVSSEAIRRAGALKAIPAIAALGGVVTTAPDASVRLAAAQALADIGSTGAMQALERAIGDSDRDVRITAVRALGLKSHRSVLLRLEHIVKGRDIRKADLTEKMAFFESYGSICGEAGVAYLDDVLNRKGLFGKKEDPELRACAAIALGRIGGAKATEALERAASERDIVVRNAISRALRSGGA